jgi:alpha-L-fucosidase
MISRPRAALFLILSLVFCLHLELTHAQNFTEIKPSPQQVEWQDLEFGVLIHYGPNSFMDREWGDGKADPKVFNPSELDAEQWMRAIKAAGAKYVVFVAKHHDGFCLWPTAQTDYNVEQSLAERQRRSRAPGV